MHRYDGGKYGKEILEGDIHTVNQEAAELPTRDNAKTFIYGFLYGAGNEKIGEIIGKGAKEGGQIKKRFLKKLPALKRLLSGVKSDAEKGHITGLDGRRIPIRHPHAALNTLLQSAGAIICKRWYVIINRLLEEQGIQDKAQMVAFVHDEVQIVVEKGYEEQVGEITQKAIKETERHYKFDCPLDSEYKQGQSWAETH
jgi:DNA polymerase I-like protein with 3'-5' exonuclease and polymerase domains